MHECRDVFTAIAQRRDGDDEGAEAEIQILAKRSLRHRLFQIAVRRGDDAGVHLDGPLGPDAPDFTLLQGAQQLRLYGRRNLADLVEEQGAVASDFEEAGLVTYRAGERAADMAEQLGFQQRSR